jgi:hypothetical protein
MATYEYITSNGTIVPDTASIQADVIAEYQEVYGSDISTDTSTEIGRQIDAETTSRISVARNNALLANQINPNQATGVFLDADYALMGGQRDAAEQSTVECTLTGVVGTIIPAGSYVQDVNDQLWQLVDETTIPSGNTIDASFRSVDFGEINAAPGDITKIVSGVVGWETVTNAASAVPGKTEQSDVSTRNQRQTEIGQNSKSNAFSIIAAIRALEGVAGVSYRENVENTSQTIDGVLMVPHSNYVCVDGGVNSEIAEAYQIKSGGSNYNGSVIVPYTDPDSGQVINVKFDRPTEKPMLVQVTAKVGASTNAVQDIKDAVIAYANGEVDGENGFALGEDTSPFEIGSAVNVQLSDVFVNKVQIATVAAGDGAYSTDTINNEIFEKATIEESNIEVIIL